MNSELPLLEPIGHSSRITKYTWPHLNSLFQIHLSAFFPEKVPQKQEMSALWQNKIAPNESLDVPKAVKEGCKECARAGEDKGVLSG